jgi:hypothetical protein
MLCQSYIAAVSCDSVRMGDMKKCKICQSPNPEFRVTPRGTKYVPYICDTCLSKRLERMKERWEKRNAGD